MSTRKRRLAVLVLQLTARHAESCSDLQGYTRWEVNGQPAFCSDLAAACSHTEHGAAIRADCPATCGACPAPPTLPPRPPANPPHPPDIAPRPPPSMPPSPPLSPSPAPAPPICADLPETSFTIGDTPATCAMLLPYCQSTAYGHGVRTQCPATCGLCTPPPSPPPPSPPPPHPPDSAPPPPPPMPPVAPPSPPARPPPPPQCDDPPGGVTTYLVNGAPATCAELVYYCTHDEQRSRCKRGRRALT